MKYFAEAVKALRPNNNFFIKGNELVWLDDEALKPSKEEIDEKVKEFIVDEKRQQIEEIEGKLIQQVLDDYDYDDRGDVAIWATKGILEKNPFYKEAMSIQKWIKQMDIKMYELQDRINIENVYSININELAKEFPEFKGITSESEQQDKQGEDSQTA